MPEEVAVFGLGTKIVRSCRYHDGPPISSNLVISHTCILLQKFSPLVNTKDRLNISCVG